MRKSEKVKVLSVIVMLFVVSLSSFAQDATPRVDRRQDAQRARIADGRRDGEVSRREAALLNAQQRHIRRDERRAEADGKVTPNERRRLERKQNRASRNIRRAKHNDVNADDNN